MPTKPQRLRVTGPRAGAVKVPLCMVRVISLVPKTPTRKPSNSTPPMLRPKPVLMLSTVLYKPRPMQTVCPTLGQAVG